MFAAGLVTATVNYEELKRDNVLDGPDDKKIDFFWLDRTQKRVIIAQGTESIDWKDGTPAINKASDLNTALTWLFDSDPKTIAREDVRAAAEELRLAIAEGDVQDVEVYYFHNHPAAPGVDVELNAVRGNLLGKVKALGSPAADDIQVTVAQIDRDSAAARLRSRFSAIAVADEIRLVLDADVQTIQSAKWKALMGPIGAPLLVDLVAKYGTALYSANIRDYLGARRSAHNINEQIRKTAAEDPDKFWVFNNGVTFVSRQVSSEHSREVRCQGLAVTNGAQTIGSLHQAHAEGRDLSKVLIQARFISTDDAGLIDDIIRYNNTQNPIFGWEQRVHDPVQARIKTEFTARTIAYVARRGQGQGGANTIELSQLAPWLAALHGDPGSAHRNSRDLFEDETKYNALFNRSTNVRHLLFTYRLGESIGTLKDDLKSAILAGTGTTDEYREYSYFRFGAFKYVLLDLAGELIVTLFGSDQSMRGRAALDIPFESQPDEARARLKEVVAFSLKAVREFLAQSESPSEQFRTTAGINSLRSEVRRAVTLMDALAPQTTSALKQGIVAG